MGNDIIKLIQEQIDAVSPILERVACLRPSPTPPRYGAQELSTGKVRYEKTTIKLIEEQVDGWQYKTRGALAGCFPGNNGHKQAFEQTIVSDRMYSDSQA